MDDIIEHLGKGLLAFFRFLVVLIWASIELVYEKVLWWLGWPMLRVITIGKYPKEAFLEGDHAPRLTQFIVGLTGIVIPLLAVYLLAKNYG
jgi:hypothetical protein